MGCLSPRRRVRQAGLIVAVVSGLGFLSVVSSALARPSAMKLFAEETLLLVRMPDAHEMVERLRQSSNARMLRDPQVKPLVDRLYGGVGELYTEKAAGALGVSWEELQQLPQGEVAFAIVARKDHVPAFVLLVDQGETPSVARRLLDQFLERLREKDGELTTETIAGVEVTVVRFDGGEQAIGLFEKDHTIVAANDPGVLREVLRHWQADDEAAGGASAAIPAEEKTAPSVAADTAAATSTEAEVDVEEGPQFSGRMLAENDKFVNILRHCRRPQDPPPNFLVFADPIGLLREFGRDNTGLKVAMATFPALGLDGIAGVGIAYTVSTDEYEDLTQMHLLLENPRAGVLQLVAFEAGETTPQPWVAEDLETYITWNWNVRASFNTLVALVDRFQYPGATDTFVAEKLSDQWGIDFPAEVIDNLAGRFTWMIGYDRPARMQGQMHLLAGELNDPELGAKTVETIVAKFSDRFEKRKFGDVSYYAFVIPWPEEMKEEDRPFAPMMGVVDGYFFIGGSCQLFEQAIAARDGTIERLVDSPGYQRVVNQVQHETPGEMPAVWMHTRFERSLRHWYDLLTSERSKEFLDENAEGNAFFRALTGALAANELPPFDVVARYTSPAGGIIYDTDSGFHGISFTLKNEAAP